ncbi:MAG: sigma 54-interacting transcriptional regulator, partial [Gemmatimonadota bacterium]|nr:sigma 54-interacting transcriptional regulator [Gemmatimonadota bacterium]
DRAGRFEIASGGTLFLDEIGNLPLPLQVKLLAVLQNQQVVRVGANQPVSVDVRLICATNQPIHEMATAGTFRQDLLYRINTVEIDLPPLRERPEDIALLARHFLDLYRTKYRKALTGLTAEALAHLRAYAWPGNVRELQHAVERAVIMSEGNRLTADDFPLTAAPSPEESVAFDSYNLEDVEREVIARVLRKHQGNVSQTARELGLTRTALYRRMEKYGL